MKRYYDAFDRTQLKVYRYDDFHSDPATVVQEMLKFIGVDDTFLPDMSTRYNPSDVPLDEKPPLRPEVRKALVEEYREDILKLQDLTGLELSRWLEG